MNTKIRELRKAAGLTQQQLSERMGLKSISAVAMWETGERTPNLENIKKLAEIFGTTVDYLVG